MTGAELKQRLHDVGFTAGMSSRYHHFMESRWGFWDKTIRIVVALLAAAGLYFTLRDADVWHGFTASLLVAVVSLMATMVLNIVPVGDWEKRHGELHRLWMDMLADVNVAKARAAEQADDERIEDREADFARELSEKADRLNASEPPAKRNRVEFFYGEEAESIYGEGIRTHEQVEAHLRKVSGRAGAAAPDGATPVGSAVA